MKKIILALTLLLMSVPTLQASNQHALKHANPMPNLMRIAMKNANLLGIDKKQMMAMNEWETKSKPMMKEMVKKVMMDEKMLHDKALNSDADINKEAQAMLETRKNIIAMKTKCRDTLKGILTKEQYANVINIYKSVR